MLGPKKLVYGQVPELGVRPEPFGLYDKPLVPCSWSLAPRLPCSDGAVLLTSPCLQGLLLSPADLAHPAESCHWFPRWHGAVPRICALPPTLASGPQPSGES